MATGMGDPSSSSPPSPSPSPSESSRPVVVRVKRKATQEKLDAFWLEICEKPSKRLLLDFPGLSLSDAPEKDITEVSGTRKLLVQHVETISNSDTINNILQPFLPAINVSKDCGKKAEERLSSFKQLKKQDHLRSVARKEYEEHICNARFQQIWKSRRNEGSADTSFREICDLYDVIRIDDEKRDVEVQEQPVSAENNAILCNYLSLLRELIPSAAEEIESDITSNANKGGYVYDVYTDNELNRNCMDASTDYPLVQVSYDNYEFYDDCPIGSDCETDDSNAENNPRFDYPEEESDDENDSQESDASDDEYDSDPQHSEETDDDELLFRGNRY